MGRWGHRLFEGDQDLDTVSDVSGAAKKELKALMKNTDIGATTKAKELHDSLDENDLMDFDVDDLRKILDAGLCDRLFTRFRTKTKDSLTPELRVILPGMLMMRAGATINTDDFEYMRTVLPRIPSQSGYALPIFDLGFRDAGKAQLVAALENYKNGVPRDVRAASCYKCGKVQTDLVAETPRKCARCKQAQYCNKTCQREDWARHKKICFKDGVPPPSPSGITFLNV